MIPNQKTAYTVRPGAINVGQEYEISMTCLLLLRAINSKLEDVWVAFNADGCGDFDDLIVHCKHPHQQNSTTYFLQLKHKDKAVCVSRREFLSSKPRPDFHLKKYEISFDNILILFEQKKEIFQHFPEDEELIFILYTNRGANECDFLKIEDDFKSSFLNTNNGEVYKFEDEENVTEVSQNFLAKLLLFTKQISFFETNELIFSSLEELFKPVVLAKSVTNKIVQELLNFVSDWSRGELGSYFLLTKSIGLYKIAEIVFKPYFHNFFDCSIKYDEEFSELWSRIVRNKSIIIVENNQTTRSFIHQYICNLILERLKKPSTIKNWTGQISNKILKDFLKNFVILNKITSYSFGDVHNLLWSQENVPAILETNTPKEIDEILTVVKFCEYKLPVIILNNSPTNLGKVWKTVPKEKVLLSLNDLDEITLNLVKGRVVHFQDKSIILEDILQIENVKENIHTKDLITIALNQFVVGDKFKELPQFYVQQTIPRVYFDLNILSNIEDDVFVIHNKTKQNFDKFVYNAGLDLPEESIYNFKNLPQKKLPENCRVVLLSSNEERPNLKTEKNVHKLSLLENKKLEWRGSSGSVEKLRKFKLDETLNTSNSITAQNLMDHLQHQVVIVSSGPGMGKTTLMDFLAKNSFSRMWTLRVNLNEYLDYYESEDFMKNHENPQKHAEFFWQDLLEKQKRVNVCNQKLFKKLLHSKKIVVLLDGFDEIVPEYKEQVMEMSLSLFKKGYKICLTTRPTLRAYLEEAFNTFAVTLNPFTRQDQIVFLTSFFNHGVKNVEETISEKINHFTGTLLDLTSKNLNDWDNGFTGVPLQTRLLAEVFQEDCRNYLKTNQLEINENFDLLFLYEKFTTSKIKILEEKIGKYAKNLHGSFFGEYQNLNALKVIFRREDIKKLNIDVRLEIFSEMVNDALQLVQKDGIVIADDDVNLNFVHRTFAEYLAAKWLAVNFKSKYKETATFLIDRIFDVSYTVIRNIFDRILAKGCPLHLAVINGNAGLVQKLLDEDLKASGLDGGGRSVLHMVASWGQRHSMPKQDEVISPWIYEPKPESFLVVTKEIINQIGALQNDQVLNLTPFEYSLKSDTLAIADVIASELEASPFKLEELTSYFYYCSRFGYLFLLKAITKNSPEEDVQAIVNKQIDKYSLSPVEWSAREGHKEVLAHLVSVGGDVNIIDETGVPLLHALIMLEKLEMLPMLLEIGADVNILDRNESTPLFEAAVKGYKDVVELLINNGADINIPNVQNLTPLQIAATKGNVDIISIFIAQGQEVEEWKLSKLHLATINNNLKLVQTILDEGQDPNVKDDLFEWTPLHWAANAGFLQIAFELITRGAEVDLTDEYGSTPLHWAADKGREEVVKLLLSKGADVGILQEEKITPLYKAVYKRHHVCVKLLLEHGSDPNAVDENGWTTLHWASSFGDVELMRILIKHGAKVNATDSWTGATPLHWAIINESTGPVLLLLEHGADVNLTDHEKKTPLCDAINAEKYEICKILLAHGSDVNVFDLACEKSCLLWAASGNKPELLNDILMKGAEINHVDIYGYSALHWAAKDDKVEMVTSLLQAGVDVNIQDLEGNTALHLASSSGFCASVELLLAAGASVSLSNLDGNSALDCAKIALGENTNQAEKVVELLENKLENILKR